MQLDDWDFNVLLRLDSNDDLDGRSLKINIYASLKCQRLFKLEL